MGEEKKKMSPYKREEEFWLCGVFWWVPKLCVIFIVVPTFTCRELHTMSTHDLLELVRGTVTVACVPIAHNEKDVHPKIVGLEWGVGVGKGAGETWLKRGRCDNWDEDPYLPHLKTQSMSLS